MNEIMMKLAQLSGGSMQQVGVSEQQMLIAMSVSAVIGLILCFFGLKLVRVLSGVTGLTIGMLIGVLVAYVTELSGMAFAGAVIGCGIVLAVLAGIFYRVGLVLWAFVSGSSIGAVFIGPDTLVKLLICVAIGLGVAVVTAIFWKFMVAFLSSLCGGITAGSVIAELAGFRENIWILLAVCAVLVVLGMVVQLMTKSREVSKKEQVYSKKVKENASMETEVEKARHLLEDESDSKGSSEKEEDDDIEILDLDDNLEYLDDDEEFDSEKFDDGLDDDIMHLDD